MPARPSLQAEQRPLIELERRQDEVLQRLAELDASITSLVAEFNHRLAESAVPPHDPSNLPPPAASRTTVGGAIGDD